MNPSAWPLRIVIACIGGIATLIALYLGLFQWGLLSTVWDPVFGDGTKNVLTSPLSHDFTRWIRMPDAVLGVFAYLSDVVFSLAGSSQRWQDRPWLVLLFGICVIPVGAVSITLVVLQGLVVKAWCFLCLCTAAISLTLIILAYGEVRATCEYLIQLKKRATWSQSWWALWGYPCHESLPAAHAVIQRRIDRVGKNR
jgi:uncharacterized membrane protein